MPVSSPSEKSVLLLARNDTNSSERAVCGAAAFSKTNAFEVSDLDAIDPLIATEVKRTDLATLDDLVLARRTRILASNSSRGFKALESF